MRLKPHQIVFLAFTAVFAVLAGFVFWGAWALDMVPIMPDCPTSFPIQYIRDWFVAWRESGKFVPGDLTIFLFDPYFWVELRYALAAYFAALALAYYLRGRALSLTASYGAALLLGFCGYWFSLFSAGHLGWFQWMTYGVFAFGLIDRAIRKNKLKNWILLGATVAWASFYQPDLWLLFTFFAALYFVWCAARERRLPDWRGVAISLGVFLAIALASLRSAALDKDRRDSDISEAKESGSSLAGGGEKDEREARWIFVTNWSLPPDETIEFVRARVNGDTSCPMVQALGSKQKTGVEPYTGALGRPVDADWGNYRQHSLYVGYITCLFALIGVLLAPFCFKGKARAEVYFFLGAAVLFYLLSLGRYFAPLYRLVFALPVGDSIRCPVKWHHLTEFSIAVLAGFGIESARRLLGETGRIKAMFVDSILVFAIIFGAWDLAKVDRLYLAIHSRDTQIAPIPDRIPALDKAGCEKLKKHLASQGLKEIGVLKSKQLCPIPANGREAGFAKKQLAAQNWIITGERKVKGQHGEKIACWVLESSYPDNLWVEVKEKRPELRKLEHPLRGMAFALAALSALATLLVLGYMALGLFKPKVWDAKFEGKSK